MDRIEFETLRDLPGKVISSDIVFNTKRQTSPLLTTDDLKISNGSNIDARMVIQYNPEVGSKTINIHVQGLGPVCRLDVDGPAHRPCGRSHKHSLQSERCPDRNLPDNVIDRPDLAGRSLLEVFQEFCTIANITHTGTFVPPLEGEAE